MQNENLEELAINSIRALSIDAIENAKSGHPGMPMGAATMAYTLWNNIMVHNPKNPNWFNRDRFVLSAGHGSMLLYSLLHLSGYNVSMDDIKSFRQWGANTPGHPEVIDTEGVETTTGPLGQGIATAVGMAMAEAKLSALYNKDNFPVIDHYTYALVSDGDIMEGVSYEASSLAGQLGLGKLIVLYDSNDISLDGDIEKSFSENTLDRFKSHGWETFKVTDGNNVAQINEALSKARKNKKQPSLIEVKTIIGYGSPNKSDSPKAHGAPLGKDEALLAKRFYNWGYAPFEIPSKVYKHYADNIVQTGKEAEEKWENLLSQYRINFPDEYQNLMDALDNKLPLNWSESLPLYNYGDSIATRKASGDMINNIAKIVPGFIGGSADITESNNSNIDNSTEFSKTNYQGRNILFGVREFAMASALNGLSLHGGIKPFGATFFIFSDYMRSAVRLSALMNNPVTYIWTHDSIALGEDGKTHQPIEHLASLRAMPNFSLIRPADGNEVNAAWQLAMEADTHPTGIVLSRQSLPIIKNTKEKAYNGVKKGAYIISEEETKDFNAIIIANGSEVHLAIEAQKRLKEDEIDVRVVSFPSWDKFEKQPQSYKDFILPPSIKNRLSVEMGSSQGWREYVGEKGKIISIDTFGSSAPANVLIEKYGFTVENIIKHVKNFNLKIK